MNTHPSFCPSCGQSSFAAVSNKEWQCAHCHFRYFHNVAGAVAAVITCGDEVLFAVRAHDPQQGFLDFPGGFVDPDETLEEALLRELQEELHWQPDTRPRYLFSGFNTYCFADVTYKTVDMFFHIHCDSKPTFTIADDVTAVVWTKLDALDTGRLAFDVMRKAVEKLQHVLR